MAFLEHVLQSPSYGWRDGQGELVRPSKGEIIKEFFNRLNVFRDRKNWLPFLNWFRVICLLPFFALFVFKFFSPFTCIAVFVYGMMIMGTHGTIWHHRYCTHRAYKFKNGFWQF